LTNIVSKILASVIIRRLTTTHDLQMRQNQAGFRPVRDCVDQIFTTCQVLEHRHTFRRPTMVIFLDLTVAFDSVGREVPWQYLSLKVVLQKVHTLVTPKPTSVSWIPVRNYRFILSNEAKKKDKFLTVVKIWFELAASSQADLLSIEDFIAILHDYSPSLLRDVIQSVDENDSTCLHYSVGHGAWQVVNLILDTGHAHPNHCNQSGFSPIMIATLSNVNDSSALKTLSRLFTMGDVNLSTNTPARQSPLMLAALHGALDICSLLIAHGANINAQDASGNTALMYAIEQGHVNVIKCILGYGDLDLTLVDNNGKNALAVAKSKGDSEVLNLIQSAYSSTKGTSSTSEISLGIRKSEPESDSV
ncbi:KN motif and ankyrin repeat domain-containing protein, partial [Schistosoma japonicum]